MKIWTDKKFPIVLSCAKGLAPWVEKEVKTMGYRPIDITDNVVVVEGNIRDVFKLNLYLRTAHRVLVPLLRSTCRHVRELYDLVASIDWENLLDADGYFSVSSIVHNDTIRDTRMPSLVTKDAIVDRIRSKCNRRPDSGSDYSQGAAVFVHWDKQRLIVYLDTSGAPLSKRGYRKIPGSAPMQETLAAACIYALKWNQDTPFVVPMCGSGTPAIEAALMAINRAPGSLRSHFAFMALKGYNQIIPGEKAPKTAPRQRFGVSPEQIWKEMVFEASQRERKEGIPPIIATDISIEAIHNAQVNAHTADVLQYIQFKDCDFADTPIPEYGGAQGHRNSKWDYRGCVFFNPEYGIRLGDPVELAPIYERIGTFMNEKCKGYVGGLITGNPELSKLVNLYYVTRIPFYNGPIDCRLFVYPNCELKGENDTETTSTSDLSTAEGDLSTTKGDLSTEKSELSTCYHMIVDKFVDK